MNVSIQLYDKFVRLETVGLGELFECGGRAQRAGDFTSSVHARRPVCVQFAKCEIPRSLVEKNVVAGERQRSSYP